MKINIITLDNGVGLYQDYLILKSILGDVNFIDWNHPKMQTADLNIHCEQIRFELVHLAPRNICIPNQEWFYPQWIQKIDVVDQIVCKTHHAVEVFSQHHPNVVYSSFTSIDHYQETNKYRTWFHLQGDSANKSTHEINEVFKRSGRDLIIVGGMRFPYSANITRFKRVPEDDLRELMNSCMLHLCPSRMEGFGHYINEARSCGAVILTTNAPPMNELVMGTIDVSATEKHNMGIMHHINIASLQNEIARISNLSDNELVAISEENRQKYLDNDVFFKQRIKEIVYEQ